VNEAGRPRAALGAIPPAPALFQRPEAASEEKYDGRLIVAYKDCTAVRLVSRAGKEHSRRFAELTAAIRALPPATLILDGEVAIFDGKLISRFEWSGSARGCRLDAAVYMVFDRLYLDGRDLRPSRSASAGPNWKP
jgi:bifunctional non-homologous end joining protein LigD